MTAALVAAIVVVVAWHTYAVVTLLRALFKRRAAERIARDALERESASIASAERAMNAARHSSAAYDKLWAAFVPERRARLWALRMLASTASAATQQLGATPDDAEAYASIAGEAMGQVIELEQQSADLGIDLTEPADDEPANEDERP